MRLVALPLFLSLIAAPAAAETLRIYNWSDYIGETTIADFEKETGIKVTYDVYDNNDVLEAKLAAGRSGYDLVVPTLGTHMARQIKAGLYQKLDKSKLPNLGNLDPELMRAAALLDPDNAHGVIWMWGTNGFGYNKAKVAKAMVDAPVESWRMMFDKAVLAKLSSCGVSFLDAASEVFPLALHYLGLDPNSEKDEDLAKAEALLKGLRPHIKYFHSSRYINDLANGDICVAMGWSGDVLQAARRAKEAKNGQEIVYVIPKEGTDSWFDVMGIPKDAPNAANAHRFIDWVLQPKVMAGVTNAVSYANAVPASLPFVKPEVAQDPGVFPPAEVRARLFAVTPVSQAAERKRSRAWARIKSGT